MKPKPWSHARIFVVALGLGAAYWLMRTALAPLQGRPLFEVDAMQDAVLWFVLYWIVFACVRTSVIRQNAIAEIQAERNNTVA